MKRLTSLLAAFVAILCLTASTVPAQAASSSGLNITPRKNVTVKPGESVKDKLQISNLNGKETLYLTLRLVDFTFTDNTGTPKLMLAQDAPQTTWSIKPFLKLSDTNVTIPAGGTKAVDYTVNVPKGQGAGSYYSAILYSAGGSDGGNVNLNASGVTLAFLSVPGVVKQDLTLKKLGAYQKAQDAPTGKFTFINTDKPKEIGFTLENKGNVAESPTGSIIIKRTFSNQEIQIDNINPNGSLALLGQTRLFTTCFSLEEKDVTLGGTNTRIKECGDSKLLPGRYTVSLDLIYGQNGNLTHEISGTASFWYLPWWFILGVLGAIALIAYFVWRIVTKIRAVVKGTPYKKRSRRR